MEAHMNTPNGRAAPTYIDDEAESRMICPHCFAYTIITTTDDVIICNTCKRIITEEDLEYVFAEDTTFAR